MRNLNQQQYDGFWRDGFLMMSGAVAPDVLQGLRDQLDDWIETSRSQTVPWGETGFEFPRFDLEQGHSATQPRLRRVNNPAEISQVYEAAAFASAMTDMVVDLIGPDVKFHHGKINAKLAQTGSRVGLHQDFSYTPHTNDDIVTALMLLDEVTLENGPLQVVAGSHRGPQLSLWQDGRFSGELGAADRAAMEPQLRPLTGQAGDVCLMHTSLVHGSDPNRSPHRRALLISVYTASDAFMLAPSPLPNRFEGRVVAGGSGHVARLTRQTVELPSSAHRGSFFNLAGQGTN